MYTTCTGPSDFNSGNLKLIFGIQVTRATMNDFTLLVCALDIGDISEYPKCVQYVYIIWRAGDSSYSAESWSINYCYIKEYMWEISLICFKYIPCCETFCTLSAEKVGPIHYLWLTYTCMPIPSM